MSHVFDRRLAHAVAGCGTEPCDSPGAAACHLRASRDAWLAAVGRALQGVAMIVAGTFLLSRMSIAPNLVVQVVLLGTLLVVGGCAFAISAAAMMSSHVTVDRDGLRGRLGHTAFDIPWAEVTRWRVSDHDGRLPAIACAEVWMRGGEASRTLPGGYLDRETRRRLRESCRSFAPDRERA